VSLLVVGLNHRSATIDLLDQVVMPSDRLGDFREDLARSPFLAEVMVLSTCNRIEVIAEVDRFHGAVGDITEQLAKYSGVDRIELADHVYAPFDEAAVKHVFSVAAGLDSMVIGEQQIVSQLREALRAAQEAGTAARGLNAVGQRALRAAKRVRSETGIDRHGASVVSVGLELSGASLGGLANRSALVIGAGAMSSLVVSGLAGLGLESIVVANRTSAKATRLALAYGARAAELADLDSEVADADLVVTATGSADIVLSEAGVRRAMATRPAKRALVVLDLAVPHDTDAAIADVAGVRRIDLSEIALAPQCRVSTEYSEAASRIVADEVALFMAERQAERIEPVLVSLRAKADEVIRTQVVRLRGKLPALSDADLAVVEQSMRRSISELLHTPTVRMKQYAGAADGERYAEVINALFDLDPLAAGVAPPSVPTPPASAPTEAIG